MFSHDAINRELRTLARADARERLSMEDRLLLAGHIDQAAVGVSQGLPVPTSRRWRVRLHRLFAGARRARSGALRNAL
jgi:hypothetical protein